MIHSSIQLLASTEHNNYQKLSTTQPPPVPIKVSQMSQLQTMEQRLGALQMSSSRETNGGLQTSFSQYLSKSSPSDALVSTSVLEQPNSPINLASYSQNDQNGQQPSPHVPAHHRLQETKPFATKEWLAYDYALRRQAADLRRKSVPTLVHPYQNGSTASNIQHRRPSLPYHGPSRTKGKMMTHTYPLSDTEEHKKVIVKKQNGQTVYQCPDCGKGYKHLNCLTKHRWEHTVHWQEASKLSLSKHQQVQMLEAAQILVSWSNSRANLKGSDSEPSSSE
ncbi:hypothetical protein ROZALSC1DRAFT_26451 [Rozella allomycis CSF55]|uniref:Zinc finger, C2H2 domain-containing protein n=1 Tax=Rozella allomycis (strain CSF55) TaxID=988480 RepID=A0A075ASP2_ROZAC|nr:Zinc finger, C2H2 domain-containing protein [Rozella allomycis CSF55]RKP22155.1 hypothetical protein ROZALSC1DRAFT_26451 [Rozella allomycis CSF55]|eukprot:EPZ31731.1 Zinc finger, C2H2 domain-containing protein [Rozella allomycis CSF55]